jgi:hypothetical protein
MTKVCTKCRTERSIEEFNNWSRGKDGKFHQCKICCYERYKNYRKNNRSKLLLYGKNYYKTYYKNNKESVIASHKKDYEQNKEKWKLTRKKYYEENKSRLLKIQKERLKDPVVRVNRLKRSAIREKERCKEDINFKLKKYLRTRVWNALKGRVKSKRTRELLGATIEIIKDHLQSKFVEGMSWENYGKWHVDHIIPCDSFDLSIEENQKKCFHYTNLQPLWAIDNILKSNKLVSPLTYSF